MSRPSSRPRAGAILPMVAILMIFLLGMVAFAVDIGYIAVVQKEMQNAADAAALAGTSQLLDRGRLKGSPNQAAAISKARDKAQQFSALNKGGSATLNLDRNNSNDTTGDIVCGYLGNPRDLSSPLDATAVNYNSVQVRLRRNAQQNGSLNLFFGSVFSRSTQDVIARATATYEGGWNVIGFTLTGTKETTAPLIPFALDTASWASVTGGTGPDAWSYDPTTGAYTPGGDGIKEINLYPTKGITPGNFGTVDLGNHNNSTPDIERQIRYGVNQSDLDAMGGKIALGPNGTLTLQGDTGISAGFKDALASIRGQKRVIPIYSAVTGQGNNTYYTVVAFGGVTVLDVKLTGMNKKLIVQPEYVVTPTAIVDNSWSVTNGFIYRPLKLTR